MRNRLIARIGVVLGVLLFASTASAMSTYTEVLGYGDLGYVKVGKPLEYDHTFAPAELEPGTPVHMSKVRLEILLTEDLHCRRWVQCRYDIRSEAEWAVIEVEGTEIFDEQVIFKNFVVGDVTMLANITSAGESFAVTIRSTDGDFVALYSKAQFRYKLATPRPSGGAPVPEPSSALVFGVGLLVLARRLRC